MSNFSGPQTALTLSASGTPTRSTSGPLGHPLHRIQRSGGNSAVSGLIQRKLRIGAADSPEEREADRVAAEVMRMPDGTGPAAIECNCCGQHTIVGRSCSRCDTENDVLQKKLVIGAPGDPLEREADRVADQVTRMGTTQEQSYTGATPLLVQLQETATKLKPMFPEEPSDLEEKLAARNGKGDPLSSQTRDFMEQRFDADFSQVRVHIGGDAQQMNQALNSHAFTHLRNVYFGAGNAPGMNSLTAHELTHVLQQEKVTVASSDAQAIRRDNKVDQPDLKNAPQNNDAADALAEGLDTFLKGLLTVLEHLKDQEGFKTYALNPAKSAALTQWEKLSGGEKAGIAGFGAGSYGFVLGAGLGNPAGRKQLSDVNLAAPLGLIPYSVLTDVRYVQPASATDPTLVKASFSGNDLLDLAYKHLRWAPPMSLNLDVTWSRSLGGETRLSSITAIWGVIPGLSLKVGSGVGLDWQTTVAGADGQNVTVMKSLPAPTTQAKTGPLGVGLFLTVDLLKAPFVPILVRAELGASSAKK